MAKVLVVDDEHSQTEVLAMLLNLEGFEVAVATNGRDALVQRDLVQPDLIVTDYMIPVMNGGGNGQAGASNTVTCRGTVSVRRTHLDDGR